MAATQADLDELDAAIASGATEVRYADKSIKYRSLAEMRSIRVRMAAEVAGKKPTRRRVARYSPGY